MSDFKIYEPWLPAAKSGRRYELISFTKTTEGNCAVVHSLDDGVIEPWIAVSDLTVDTEDNLFWDYGFYFNSRRDAERKFYDMTGLLKPREESAAVNEAKRDLILSSFDSIHIDLEKDILEINGIDVHHSDIAMLQLLFENGLYELPTDNKF